MLFGYEPRAEAEIPDEHVIQATAKTAIESKSILFFPC